MAQLQGEDVVFVGLGRSVVCWYRCALPAYHLGCRWIGYAGHPPGGSVITGNTMQQHLSPEAARVWILQEPRGTDWLGFIRTAKRGGAKVLYEVDDYMHGVERLAASDGDSIPVTREILAEYEMCMEASDGIVCATDYIAGEYSKFNRTWVCRNGIDTARFNRRRPQREKPNVGWFGGLGHDDGLRSWAPQVVRFCNDHDLTFFSIGQQYECWEPMKRLVRIPFLGLENVPDALANVDIGLAPWYDSPFYAGKSDLRVLEGAAAGVAMLADPMGYGHLPNSACWFARGGTDEVGFWLEQMITEYHEKDRSVGAMGTTPWQHIPFGARAWVERERDASVTAGDWEVPLNDISKEM